MTFVTLSPWMAWLLVATALALAAGMFMIPPRPSRALIPSLVVWRRVVAEPQQRSLWDRLRRIISLILTLTIAGTIALAVTRPLPAGVTPASRRTLIVLDSSWSMNARTPSGLTRWEQAVRGARAMADAAPAGEIALATTAEGVIEGPTFDRAVIRSAFEGLAPSGGSDGAWPRIAGVTDVHLFTDGATARALDADVAVHSVFTPVSNVAVTAFDVRPASAADADDEVFVAVSNYAQKSQTVRLVVTRGAAVILERTAELAAGETHREVLPVAPGGDPRFHAHVSATENALEIR